MTSTASRGSHAGTGLERLRTPALIAVLTGAAGSIALLIRAREHPPLLLAALFVVWVLAPFAALAAAHVMSKRWSHPTRATLYVTMLLVTLGSLAVYVDDALEHRAAKAAFVWVIVPPVSWLLVAAAVPIAVLASRRRSRPGEAA